MRILIVEDEVKTAQYLQKGLAQAGYTVDICHDGEEGFQLALTSDFDLLILDAMLPSRDGWSVISELRRRGRHTVTLMLTARGEIEDRIRGLDLGADAYFVKPFSFLELLALVRSLLRRSPVRQADVVRIEDLEIDMFKHSVFRSGQPVELTPKEFALVAYLARRAGEVVSRTVLSEQAWGLNFDSGTNIVDVHIRRIRAKIDDPFEKKLIHTVRGIGYSIRADEAQAHV